MALTRRIHVLLDDLRHELLRAKSAETGRSVGDLIREAIDRSLGDEEERERLRAQGREQALESFLAADSMPVDDWPAMKREIEELQERPAGKA